MEQYNERIAFSFLLQKQFGSKSQITGAESSSIIILDVTLAHLDNWTSFAA